MAEKRRHLFRAAQLRIFFYSPRSEKEFDDPNYFSKWYELSSASGEADVLQPEAMKRLLQWTMLTALVAGTASAADVRLGLNTSATLGCEVAGVRAGVQEGRFGGYIQGSYCTSNVQGESGAGAFGGGLTVDFYQSLTLNAYGQLGAVSQPNGNPSIYGGVGVRYGIPLVPVEAYLEGGVSHRSTIIGGLTAPRFALGLNYVWRGVNLNEISGGESRPSNISAPGTGGLNVDASGGGPQRGGRGGPQRPVLGGNGLQRHLQQRQLRHLGGQCQRQRQQRHRDRHHHPAGDQPHQRRAGERHLQRCGNPLAQRLRLGGNRLPSERRVRVKQRGRLLRGSGPFLTLTGHEKSPPG